jgi:hypothetical protein
MDYDMLSHPSDKNKGRVPHPRDAFVFVARVGEQSIGSINIFRKNVTVAGYNHIQRARRSRAAAKLFGSFRVRRNKRVRQVLSCAGQQTPTP